MKTTKYKFVTLGAILTLLAILWVGCGDAGIGLGYKGRWNDWCIEVSGKQIGILFEPSQNPRIDDLCGFVFLGKIETGIGDAAPHNTFDFDAFGLTVSFLAKGRIDHDTVTRRYAYVGVPHWLLLLLAIYIRQALRRRRVRLAKQPGFEVAVKKSEYTNRA